MWPSGPRVTDQPGAGFDLGGADHFACIDSRATHDHLHGPVITWRVRDVSQPPFEVGGSEFGHRDAPSRECAGVPGGRTRRVVAIERITRYRGASMRAWL